METPIKPPLLPNHVTISEYAKLKDWSRVTIYRYIEAGKIIPDQVGRTPVPMINWKKYKNLELVNIKKEK